eukprot:494404_1
MSHVNLITSRTSIVIYHPILDDLLSSISNEDCIFTLEFQWLQRKHQLTKPNQNIMTQDVLPTQGIFTDQVGNDIGAMFAILIGAMIAAGGGLGGGGVFVPIYILILGYPPKFAAALSQATIFGGSIVNLIMNLKKSHPTRKHRPLTDFSTLLIFEPMLLVGTIIGVLLNVMFPDILILILLAIVLTYATIRTSRKGIRLWKKETVSLKKEKEKIKNNIENNTKCSIEMQTVQTEQIDTSQIINTSQVTPTPNSTNTISINDYNQDSTDTISSTIINDLQTQKTIRKLSQGTGCDPSQITIDKIELCQEMLTRESQIMSPVIIILIVWFFVSIFSIIKKKEFTGINKCEIWYWMITFLPIPIMICISYFMTLREYKYYQIKINSNCWIPAFGDIELNGKFINILKYPLIATIAGILGGLLGIGGGMIVSPLLIELGVMPTVAAATSAMAVLITSSSATLQFVLLGYLNLDYTFYFMAIGIIGTFIGQTIVIYCIKQYGRKSLIVFSVAIIMGGAVILMGSDGILQVINGISWTFASPC